jgi:hypothetical protein
MLYVNNEVLILAFGPCTYRFGKRGVRASQILVEGFFYPRKFRMCWVVRHEHEHERYKTLDVIQVPENNNFYIMEGMLSNTLLVVLVGACTFLILIRLLAPKQDPREPPLAPTTIPYIGHAIGLLRRSFNYPLDLRCVVRVAISAHDYGY